jgi:type II secretory pathway component PulJ
MVVTFIDKTFSMKKILVALVLVAGIGAIAYASLSKNSSNKQAIEKKTDKQEKKKECKKTCMFS